MVEMWSLDNRIEALYAAGKGEPFGPGFLPWNKETGGAERRYEAFWFLQMQGEIACSSVDEGGCNYNYECAIPDVVRVSLGLDGELWQGVEHEEERYYLVNPKNVADTERFWVAMAFRWARLHLEVVEFALCAIGAAGWWPALRAFFNQDTDDALVPAIYIAESIGSSDRKRDLCKSANHVEGSPSVGAAYALPLVEAGTRTYAPIAICSHHPLVSGWRQGVKKSNQNYSSEWVCHTALFAWLLIHEALHHVSQKGHDDYQRRCDPFYRLGNFWYQAMWEAYKGRLRNSPCCATWRYADPCIAAGPGCG